MLVILGKFKRVKASATTTNMETATVLIQLQSLPNQIEKTGSVFLLEVEFETYWNIFSP
jgi:hypothetical protein